MKQQLIRAARTFVVVTWIGTVFAPPARADIISGPPTSCPNGSDPMECHSGGCAPRTCTTDAECLFGRHCVERYLCVGRMFCRGGQVPDVTSECTNGAGCEITSTCTGLRVCVADPVPEPTTRPAPTGPGNAGPPAAATRGCACHVSGGTPSNCLTALALSMLAGLCVFAMRRRARASR